MDYSLRANLGLKKAELLPTATWTYETIENDAISLPAYRTVADDLKKIK